MLYIALIIRQEYTHPGLAKSHDMLQQLQNLTNMLILSKNTNMTKQLLSIYENFVLENEGTQTLDNGVCQMMYDTIALSKGNAKEAEFHHFISVSRFFAIFKQRIINPFFLPSGFLSGRFFFLSGTAQFY